MSIENKPESPIVTEAWGKVTQAIRDARTVELLEHETSIAKDARRAGQVEALEWVAVRIEAHSSNNGDLREVGRLLRLLADDVAGGGELPPRT